jgi:5,10-methylene-tetrahydrofolate dehydrogenase/methenyl tetrahydrofolate cyclohydrolase
VTLLHSRGKDIEKELQSADVIVAAIGIPHCKGDMVKDGVIIFTMWG